MIQIKVSFLTRGVFVTLSNIYDGVFYENVNKMSKRNVKYISKICGFLDI